jgi:hypothetical protein
VLLVQSNLEQVLNFELANEDYEKITNIDFQLRLVDGIRFLRPEGPYRSALNSTSSRINKHLFLSRTRSP